jgi:hypothetical protein
MSLNEKIFNLSKIVKNGGYIQNETTLYIWLLEQSNLIESRIELVELFLENKYNVTNDSIINLLEENIQKSNVESKYLLCYFYLVNKKYDNIISIINNNNIIKDISVLINQNTISKYIKDIVFYMSIYFLNNNDIEYSSECFQLLLKIDSNYKNSECIYKYILYKYSKKVSLKECYNLGDLNSCYLLGVQNNDIKYFYDYIDRYKSTFYTDFFDNFNFDINNVKYIPTIKDIQSQYNLSNIYCNIYKISNELILNQSKQNKINFQNIIDKYLSESHNYIDVINYYISLAGYICKLKPENIYYTKMNKCSNKQLLNVLYYEGLMIYDGYGCNQNYLLALDIFNNYIQISKIINNNVYYYIININNKYNKIDLLLNCFNNNIGHIKKLEKTKKGEIYYIISNIYFLEKYFNKELCLEYLKKSIKYKYVDSYFKMAKLLENGKFISIDLQKSINYYKKGIDKNHKESLYRIIDLLLKNDNNNYYLPDLKYLYDKANNLNLFDCCYKLSRYYYNEYKNNNISSKDIESVLKIWKDLAKNNNSDANYYLGMYYKNNNMEYIKYFEKSKDLNNKYAIDYLGEYYKNEAIYYKSINNKKYVDLLLMSVELNNAHGQYLFALYNKENGNDSKYIKLLEESLNNGYSIAKDELDDYIKIYNLRNI